MKNIFLKALCVLACLTAAVFAAVSCSDDSDGHKHRFSEEWQADATGHWHPATCEHGGEKGDFSAHVGTADDCKCDICGYVTHTFGDEWIYNETKHWHAASCGKDSHRSDVGSHVGTEDDCTCDVCGKTVHSYGEWTTVKYASCSEKGQKRRECTLCGAYEFADIEKSTHSRSAPVYINIVPATCTANGSRTEIVYCSECGEEISRTNQPLLSDGHSHSDEWHKDQSGHYKLCACGDKSELAAHTYTDGSDVCSICGYKNHVHTASAPVRENEVAASCTHAGSYDSVIYCSECGCEISRESKVGDPKKDHTPGIARRENIVPPTCTENGSYDSVIYCTECGTLISRSNETITTTGHKYSEAWQYDENGHWKTPICGHDVENLYSAHVGMDDCVCDECGYVSHSFGDKWYHNASGHWHIGDCGNANHKSEIHPHVGMDDCVCDECGYVSHTYSDEWSHNEYYHWHESSCGHENERSDYYEHDFDSQGKCKDCGYVDPDKGAIELPIVPA